MTFGLCPRLVLSGSTGLNSMTAILLRSADNSVGRRPALRRSPSSFLWLAGDGGEVRSSSARSRLYSFNLGFVGDDDDGGSSPSDE